MSLLALLVLILLAIAVAPAWLYRSSWGFARSGVFGMAPVVIAVLALAGRI